VTVQISQENTRCVPGFSSLISSLQRFRRALCDNVLKLSFAFAQRLQI
jgi:hypothetical protein